MLSYLVPACMPLHLIIDIELLQMCCNTMPDYILERFGYLSLSTSGRSSAERRTVLDLGALAGKHSAIRDKDQDIFQEGCITTSRKSCKDNASVTNISMDYLH